MFALNILYLLGYGGYKPHILRSRFFIEMNNEWMIFFLCYHLLCFTPFVDFEVQWIIGFSYLGIVGYVLVINLGYILVNNYFKWRTLKRKKASQKGYEARFRALIKQISLEKAERKDERAKQKTLKNMEKLKFFQELDFKITESQSIDGIPDESKSEIELAQMVEKKEQIDREIKRALGKAMRGNRQFARKTKGLGDLLKNQLPLNQIQEADSEDEAYKTVR